MGKLKRANLPSLGTRRFSGWSSGISEASPMRKDSDEPFQGFPIARQLEALAGQGLLRRKPLPCGAH